MSDHLFLEKAYIFPLPKGPSLPKDCTFNHPKGYWIHNETSQALVTLKNHPKLVTKKCDIETGEDKK
jgi:hypothetical protein